jgi:hypothetical protein
MDRYNKSFAGFLIIPLVLLSALAVYLSGIGLRLIWLSYGNEIPEFHSYVMPTIFSYWRARPSISPKRDKKWKSP